MRKPLEKLLSLAFCLVLFRFLATGVHEQFHDVVAGMFGIETHVTFSWWTGQMFWDATPTPAQELVVGLVGGLGTALVMGVLWFIAHYQLRYTRWALGDVTARGITTIAQAIYAIFDGLDFAPVLGSYLAYTVAFGVVLLVYGRRIWHWLKEERKENGGLALERQV